jgi:hypothetical protein
MKEISQKIKTTFYQKKKHHMNLRNFFKTIVLTRGVDKITVLDGRE